MNKLAKLVLLFGPAFFLSNAIQAQSNQLNELDLSGNIDNWYFATTGIEQTLLMEGMLADTERKASKSHPYLYDYRWQTGAVTYRDQVFNGVPILYNIERDEVIILRDGVSAYDNFVQLKKELVDGFTIGNAKYVWVDNNPPGGKTGFYELIYNGNQLSLYAKRVKKQDINGDADFQYIQTDDYYVYFDNVFYPIRNAGSISRLFKTNRKPIKRFAIERNIRQINTDTELQFVLLIAYCNTLEL